MVGAKDSHGVNAFDFDKTDFYNIDEALKLLKAAKGLEVRQPSTTRSAVLRKRWRGMLKLVGCMRAQGGLRTRKSSIEEHKQTPMAAKIKKVLLALEVGDGCTAIGQCEKSRGHGRARCVMILEKKEN
ncbi:hypothetical protein N9L68_03720 [bacterium]|nr:hypothetical protein [bacterium]